MSDVFDIDCRQCDRLAIFLDQVKSKYPDYYAKPVPAFGDANAQLLVVGLAPGMHGANATGRPFTGDHAGILLYETLYKTGFSSQAISASANDDLKLINCRITNAVKCLPPQNKPLGIEVSMCNAYLSAELEQLSAGSVVIALGGIAHKAVLKARGLVQNQFKFSHNQGHELSKDLTLIDSYHCSRYNTQTKRLTQSMFEAVFQRAADLL